MSTYIPGKRVSHRAIVTIAALMLISGCKFIARIPEVQIKKSTGELVTVEVEVARKPDARLLGLMYRKSLDKNKGLLFIFEQEKKQTFIMKNTYIPLDMIFISRDKRIAGWVENARPLSPEQYSIDKQSQYVLEVNSFFCRAKGINVGDAVIFKNIE